MFETKTINCLPQTQTENGDDNNNKDYKRIRLFKLILAMKKNIKFFFSLSKKNLVHWPY